MARSGSAGTSRFSFQFSVVGSLVDRLDTAGSDQLRIDALTVTRHAFSITLTEQ